MPLLVTEIIGDLTYIKNYKFIHLLCGSGNILREKFLSRVKTFLKRVCAKFTPFYNAHLAPILLQTCQFGHHLHSSFAPASIFIIKPSSSFPLPQSLCPSCHIFITACINKSYLLKMVEYSGPRHLSCICLRMLKFSPPPSMTIKFLIISKTSYFLTL